MRLIIFFHFRRRSDEVELDVLASHRLDDNFLSLHLFEFAHGEVLRLKRFDEGIAVAAEILLENFVNSFFDKMIGNLEVFLLKRLNDKLAIDQILKSRRADFLDLLDELLAVKLRAQQF